MSKKKLCLLLSFIISALFYSQVVANSDIYQEEQWRKQGIDFHRVKSEESAEIVDRYTMKDEDENVVYHEVMVAKDGTEYHNTSTLISSHVEYTDENGNVIETVDYVNPDYTDQISNKEVKKIQMWADYASEMKSEKNLRERAEYVVKATILPESENVYLGKIDGYTKTKIQIDEVYKGDVKQNEIVTLIEPYFNYYDEQEDMIYEFHSELYNKSEVGKEYILFLIKSNVEDSDCYYLVNEYYGRYAVPAKEKTVAEENMTAEYFDLYDGYIEDYKKIYNEVVNVYQ